MVSENKIIEAKAKLNPLADQFNQWSELREDEKAKLIALEIDMDCSCNELGSECPACEMDE